jgi:hypothetical protein
LCFFLVERRRPDVREPIYAAAVLASSASSAREVNNREPAVGRAERLWREGVSGT